MDDITLHIVPVLKNMGMEFISLKLDLEDTLHKSVDLVSYNGISRYLKKHILSHQVQIL